MKSNSLFEISAECSIFDKARGRKIIKVFKSAGIAKAEIAELFNENIVRYAYYSQNNSLAKKLKNCTDIKLRVKKLSDPDWLTKWEKESKPFYIAGNIRIVPRGMQRKVKHRKNDIIVNSGCAFGSGDHPTTKAMAEFISEKSTGCRSLLDVGCGTGILSMIAFRKGIKDILACDISENAVNSAVKSFRENKCKIKADLQDFLNSSLKRKYDFVCANILANDILKMKEKLMDAVLAGGHLALSGIWKHDYKVFKKRMTSGDIRLVAERKEKGWHSLLYKRQ